MLVARFLDPKLEAQQRGLVDPREAIVPHEVCLVYEVTAVVAVVVAGKRHEPCGGVEFAAEHVLVKFPIVAEQRVVAKRETATEVVLDDQGCEIHVGFRIADTRIAEENPAETANGLVAVGCTPRSAVRRSWTCSYDRSVRVLSETTAKVGLKP